MGNVEKIISNCPICNVEKIYKTKQGLKKYKNSPCKSCSNSIKNGGNGNVRGFGGEKECIKCNQIKSLTEFHYYKNHKRYHSLCFDCKKISFKHYQKSIGRFKRYGITKEIYDQMVLKQDNKCYICEDYKEILYIDHNHITGEIRKLLCRDCNSALGLIKESKKTINNMKKYIENYEQDGLK